MSDFTLPELGEQIESGDVLRVLVKPGDTIAKDQPVLELETDKATIEVPSSVAGTVKEIKVKAGDKVKVGQAILSSRTVPPPRGAEAGAVEARAAKAGRAASAASPRPRRARRRKPKDGRAAKARPARGRRRESRQAARCRAARPRVRRRSPTRPGKPPCVARRPPSRGQKSSTSTAAPAPAAEAAAPDTPPAPAAPSVRRMARELGVDINEVAGSGPFGPHLDRRCEGAREAAGRRAPASGAGVRGRAAARFLALGRRRAPADARASAGRRPST